MIKTQIYRYGTSLFLDRNFNAALNKSKKNFGNFDLVLNNFSDLTNIKNKKREILKITCLFIYRNNKLVIPNNIHFEWKIIDIVEDPDTPLRMDYSVYKRC